MPYNNLGLGVYKSYGVRGIYPVAGVTKTEGVLNEFVYPVAGTSVEYTFPTGAVGQSLWVVEVDLTMISGSPSGVVTIGGVDVSGATLENPIEIEPLNTREVVVDGSTGGAVLIRFKKYPNENAMASAVFVPQPPVETEVSPPPASASVFDFSNTGTLFQDTAGTIPVTTSGQTVQRMNSTNGDGAYAELVDVTYIDDAEGPRLVFNGTTSRARFPGLTYLGDTNQQGTFAIAYKNADNGLGYLAHSDGNNSTSGTLSFGMLVNASSGTLDRVIVGGGDNSYTASTASRVMTATFDMATSSGTLRYDGNAIPMTIGANRDNDDLTIGFRSPASPAVYWEGSVYGLVIENRQMELEELEVVDAWLLDKVTTVPSTLVQQTFAYASSFDTTTNLLAKVAYDETATDLIPLVVMHGLNGDLSSVPGSWMVNCVAAGFFPIAVALRGRSGSGGSPDLNGAETYDIYDAVEYVKANYPQFIDDTKLVISGYSGGGDNVYNMIMNFPDYASVYAAHFGGSDPGVDPTTSRSEQSDSYRDNNARPWTGFRARGTWPGTEPINIDPYHVRNAREGVPVNLQGGHLFIYHDQDDTSVPVNNSTILQAALDAASNTNYTIDISTSADPVRWYHTMPNGTNDVSDTRDVWGAAAIANTYPAWTVATTGVYRVQGFLVTKRFKIVLGNGKQHYASVDYDTVAGTYELTLLSAGSVTANVTVNGVTKSQVITNGVPTTITF